MITKVFPLTFHLLNFFAIGLLLTACSSDISKEGRTTEGSIQMISGQTLNYTLHLPEQSVKGLCSPSSINSLLIYQGDTVVLKSELKKDEHIHNSNEPISISGIKIGGASIRDVYEPVEFTVILQCPSKKEWQGKTLELVVQTVYDYYELENEQAAVDPVIQVRSGQYTFTDKATILPEQEN